MIKFIILDIDGTIYEKRSVVEEYLKRFAEIEGLSFSEIHAIFTESYIEAKKEIYQSVAEFWSEVHDIFLKEINSNKRELLDKLAEDAKESILCVTKPREGLIHLLQKAKRAGIKIVLFTGSNNMYECIKLNECSKEYTELLDFKKKQLNTLGLSDYFDHLILTHKYGGFKPQKFVFHSLLKDLNANPEECIMIGDSYNDIGATQVGIFSILIGYKECNEFKPNLRVDSFEEIIDIIDFELCTLKLQH